MMEKRYKDRSFIILGFVSIGVLFFLYSITDDFSISPESMQSIERLAIAFYVLLLLSLGSISYGIYRYHQRKVIGEQIDILSIIAKSTWNSKSRKFLSLHLLAMEYFFH